jgi:hypothetical protein
MNRKIMQQALDALRISAPLGHAMEDYEYRHKVIKDIEAELAKPEQEPLKCTCGYSIGHPLMSSCSCKPRKEWVRITGDEVAAISLKHGTLTKDDFDFAYAVEAKLKEKNT